VRADQRTLAALDTERRIPNRDLQRQVAFLPLRGGSRPCAVHREGRNRQAFAITSNDLCGDIFDERGRLVRDGRLHPDVAGDLVRVMDLVKVRERVIHSSKVLLYHDLAALAIGVANGLLDSFDCFVSGQHAGDRKEAGLHDGVDAAAHAGRPCNAHCIDDIESELLGDDLFLHLPREMIPDFVRSIGAGEQEGRAWLGFGQHLDALQEDPLVAGDEVGRLDQVGQADRLGPETQVRRRNGAGLLGIVEEIALGVVVGLLTDDTDRVVVGAHCAVRAQPIKQGPYAAL